MLTVSRLALRLCPTLVVCLGAIGCGGDGESSRDDDMVATDGGGSDTGLEDTTPDAGETEDAGETDAADARDAATGSDGSSGAGATDLKQLETDWRTQMVLGATNMCTACSNKLGYASFNACLADNNGTDIPKSGEDRSCQVAAYGLDTAGSKAYLSCWLAAERAWARCVGTGFTCSSAQYSGCLDPYVASAKACPELNAEVKKMLAKCPAPMP